jgi:hypothetical protein
MPDLALVYVQLGGVGVCVRDVLLLLRWLI